MIPTMLRGSRIPCDSSFQEFNLERRITKLRSIGWDHLAACNPQACQIDATGYERMCA